MSATDVLQRIGETPGSTANVKSVFGEPIQANKIWVRTTSMPCMQSEPNEDSSDASKISAMKLP